MLYRRSRSGQHGAAALEMAFVFPVFLLLLGGVWSLTQMTWAKYVMVNLATASARFCTSASYVQESTMQSCVQSYIAMATAVAPPPTGCIPQPTVTNGIPIPGGVSNLRLLSVHLDCQVTWSALMGAAFAGAQSGPATITADAGMPYMLPQAGF